MTLPPPTLIKQNHDVVSSKPRHWAEYVTRAEIRLRKMRKEISRIKPRPADHGKAYKEDLRKLDSYLKNAHQDIERLESSNEASWERYRVHLENVFADIDEALEKTRAE